MAQRKTTKNAATLSLLCGFATSATAFAMQPLNDSEMASVSGRDGLAVNIQAPSGWHADALVLETDKGLPHESRLSLNDITLTGVNADGGLAGANVAAATFELDIGSNSAGEGMLGVSLYTDNRIRLRTDSLTIPTGNSTDSMGTWAFDFEGGIEMQNQGLFNIDYDQARLYGEINNANLFYRQGGDSNAWLVMRDFNLKWEVPEGTIGIDSQGIVQRTGTPGAPAATLAESDLINLTLDFKFALGRSTDIGNPDQEFVIQEYVPGDQADEQNTYGLMHFGWDGSIRDAEIRFMAGGAWADGDDPYSQYSQGLRFSSQWDYVTSGDPMGEEFVWRLGETATVGSSDLSSVKFELGDWRMWGARTAAKPSPHYFPLIAIDVVNGGVSDIAPHTLEWLCRGTSGCETVEIGIEPSADGALAVLVRDGQLQAYSNKVRYLETDANGTTTIREFDWGLIYALANLDANIYLYPDGAGADAGLRADLLVRSQTFDVNDATMQGNNWDHGTHLMIADTEAQMGIGFIDSSFIVAGKDVRIAVKTADRDGAGKITDFHSGGLDFYSADARFNYRATFGGGLLPEHEDYGDASKPQTVIGADLDMNLEGMVNLRFSPADPNSPAGSNYLGYSGALRLEHGDRTSGIINGVTTLETCGSTGDQSCGTYLSLAEPSQPDAAVKLANIHGDIAFENGKVDIIGSGERGSSGLDANPALKISNDILIGEAAKSGTQDWNARMNVSDFGRPMMIDNLMLGPDNLGSIAIPSAQIYSSITLEPQTAAVPFTP